MKNGTGKENYVPDFWFSFELEVLTEVCLGLNNPCCFTDWHVPILVIHLQTSCHLLAGLVPDVSDISSSIANATGPKGNKLSRQLNCIFLALYLTEVKFLCKFDSGRKDVNLQWVSQRVDPLIRITQLSR